MSAMQVIKYCCWEGEEKELVLQALIAMNQLFLDG